VTYGRGGRSLFSLGLGASSPNRLGEAAGVSVVRVIRELLTTFLAETGYQGWLPPWLESPGLGEKEGSQGIILHVKMPGIDGIDLSSI
jgi:hypothetical protein